MVILNKSIQNKSVSTQGQTLKIKLFKSSICKGVGQSIKHTVNRIVKKNIWQYKSALYPCSSFCNCILQFCKKIEGWAEFYLCSNQSKIYNELFTGACFFESAKVLKSISKVNSSILILILMSTINYSRRSFKKAIDS